MMVDKLKEPKSLSYINNNKIWSTKNITEENEIEQIEQQWNIIKQAVIEAATEITGEEERTSNEWYDECREAIREKIRTDYLCYRKQQDKHIINPKKLGKRW
jgi:hypothetical protein